MPSKSKQRRNEVRTPTGTTITLVKMESGWRGKATYPRGKSMIFFDSNSGLGTVAGLLKQIPMEDVKDVGKD